VGIKHYSDLTNDEKLYLQGHLQMKTKAKVSIKVDGSANIGFGVDADNKVYVARNVKGQNTKVYDISVYPLTPQYNAIRTAASAILNSSDIITGVLKPGDYANAEILYEATPNVITYDGSNYIFIHDDRFTDLDDNVFTSTIDVYKVSDTSVNIIDVNIDRVTETNSFIIKSNKPVQISLPYNVDKKQGVALPDSQKIFSLLNSTELISSWPTEAKPFHEGLVVEYANLIFKVVGDFPKLNKAQWQIREYIEDGYKDAGGWVYGLRYQYFDDISQRIGLPLIKAPSRKHHINKNYDGYNFFDRVCQLLKDKSITVTNQMVSDMLAATEYQINVSLARVRDLIRDATYLDDINYRKTLESYATNRDFYLSVEKYIQNVRLQFNNPTEQLAAIICFILKEDIVKDTLFKKIWRRISGTNKSA